MSRSSRRRESAAREARAGPGAGDGPVTTATGSGPLAESSAPGAGGPGEALRDLADEYIRLLAAHDPDAAAATGVPGQAILPDFSPEALGARVEVERSLRARADAVVGELTRSDALLRDHLVERLSTSIDFIDSGEEGAHLDSLTSPFQRIRDELRAPSRTPKPQGAGEADVAEAEAKWEGAWELHRLRLEALPSALEGLAASLAASAQMGVIAPRSQVDVVAGQARDLAKGRGWGLPEDLPSSLRVELQEAEADARRAAADFAEHLRANLSQRAPRGEGVGAERHALWMSRLLGARVDPVETYAWAEQELADVVAEQDAIAVDLLGSGADAAALDEHLRSDRSRGLVPGQYEAWAQDAADQAWDAVVGRVLDPPDVLGRPVVRLDVSGESATYEVPGEAGGARRPGTMRRVLTRGEEIMWPWAERATVLHATVPGHHAYSGWHASDTRLSHWQRHLGRVPGCNEGWAVYGEALGEELGLLDAPEDRFGWLAARRWRLARVLIDLGVHSQLSVPAGVRALPGAGRSWNHSTVGAVLRHHATIPGDLVRAEAARHLGAPARALSDALGERAWLAGRRAAEARTAAEGRSWGTAELRAFHNRSIALGSLGLDLLERSL